MAPAGCLARRWAGVLVATSDSYARSAPRSCRKKGEGARRAENGAMYGEEVRLGRTWCANALKVMGFAWLPGPRPPVLVRRRQHFGAALMPSGRSWESAREQQAQRVICMALARYRPGARFSCPRMRQARAGVRDRTRCAHSALCSRLATANLTLCSSVHLAHCASECAAP